MKFTSFRRSFGEGSGRQRKIITNGILVLDPCYYLRLRLALMRMGTGFGLLIKNMVKLPRMPSPMRNIQSAVIDIKDLDIKM